MKNAGIACVAVCAAMVWTGVRAEENPLLVDGVLEVKVDGSQEGFTDDQLEALKDPSCVELKKTGAGELILKSATGISSFTGTITIAEGTYTIAYQPTKTANSPLGTGDGPTEVRSGATLCFASSATGAFADEEITIAGTGANGMGALCRAGTVNSATTVKFKKLTLADDALVVANASGAGAGRYIVLSAKRFDMNGKTFTSEARTSNSAAYIEADEIVNDGHIYLKTTKDWHIPSNCMMTGGPNHILTIDAVQVPSYSTIHTNFCNWTLRFVNSGSGIRAYTPPFQWDGPVELPASGTISFYANDNGTQSDPSLLWIRFNGPISGGATIKNGGDFRAPLILAGTNTFAGKVTWSAANSSAMTVAMIPEALPGGVTNGVTWMSNGNNNSIGFGTRTASNPCGWDWTAITNSFEAFFQMNKAGNLQLYTPAGETATYVCDIDSSFDYYYRDSHSLLSGGSGDGETVIRAHYDKPNWFRNVKGENLVLTARDRTAGDNRIGAFYTHSGRITFRDMGFFTIGGICCGSSGNDTRSEVVVDTNCVMSGSSLAIGARSKSIGASGQFRVRPGALVTNALTVVGNKDYIDSHGSFIMDGGTFVGTGEMVLCASSNSSASAEIRGGDVALQRSSLFVTRHHPKTCAVWHQTGGTMTIGSEKDDRYVGFGPGTSTVYVAAGTFRSPAGAFVTMSGSATDATGGRADLTVDGGLVSIGVGVTLNDRSASEGYVNLNGGVLETPQIVKAVAGWNSKLPIEDAYSSVSFNGGAFKAMQDGSAFGSSEAAPDAVYVRAGGATIDTAGHNATVSVPLAKVPTEGGIQSLVITNWVQNSNTKVWSKTYPEYLTGYYSRPTVLIFGDGHGATAVADYDCDTFKVTGVTITNPGWGYTAAKTKAYLFLHTSATPRPLEVTIGDNAASGGLVKTGEGVLTLTAANTYEGATEIREGGLKFAGDAAVPSAGKLLLTGGYLMTENVEDFPAELHVNLGELDDAKRYVIASFDGERPATMPTVYVNNSTTYPAGYCLWYRGKDLVFGYRRGAVLLVR